VQGVLLQVTLSEGGTHLAALLWDAEWARTNATRLGKRKRALVTRKRTRISGKAYLFSEPLPSRSGYHPFVFYCGQSGSDLGGGSRLGFGQRIEGAWPCVDFVAAQ
jgi:hypothetical protein